jgi:muramoyltetrapeptide carboxypeptidase
MYIDIIAPGSSVSLTDLDAVRDMLSAWGCTPIIPDNLLGDDLLCANTDEQRFEHLKNALFNTESSVIWCMRGGYGCTRLLPKLAELPPPKHQKLLIGCSDITALHIFLQQQWGWSTLHAPGAKQAALGQVSETDILAIKDLLLSNPSLSHNLEMAPLNISAKQTTKITSTITGGNLCLIQASIGTFWQINARNKILFLEEVNERGYKIDRMLTHLQQAGIFDGLDALILGDFIGGEEPNGKSLIEPVLQRFADTCPYPVLRCLGIGHGFDNHPLPLGTPIQLILASGALFLGYLL